MSSEIASLILHFCEMVCDLFNDVCSITMIIAIIYLSNDTKDPGKVCQFYKKENFLLFTAALPHDTAHICVKSKY